MQRIHSGRHDRFGFRCWGPIRAVAVLAAFVAGVWLAFSGAGARAADDGEEFAKDPTWSIPTAKAVSADVLKWLDQSKVDAAERDKVVKELWPESPTEPAAGEILERVVKTIAEVEPQARELSDLCAKPHESTKLPQFPFLSDEKTPPFVRNNLRLWYGRWLAQEKLYDESLEQLGGLHTADVVDPASLLFYQGVVYHWLLKKQPGLEAIGKLLEQKNHIPRRYAQLATLMQADLSGLKDESLDHIDRRMRDTERRLDLGRAGKKVRGVEDGIIASLDKLIEQKEKEQEEQDSSASGQAKGTHSLRPADISTLPSARGKGEVEKKDIGHHSGWGDLKPKDRAEALQDIGEEFPSHYRAVIEQYFRRVAGDDDGDNNSDK
jgi:hypothetical protein